MQEHPEADDEHARRQQQWAEISEPALSAQLIPGPQTAGLVYHVHLPYMPSEAHLTQHSGVRRRQDCWLHRTCLAVAGGLGLHRSGRGLELRPYVLGCLPIPAP